MAECDGVGHAWPLCQLDEALIRNARRPVIDEHLQVALWWLAGHYLREIAAPLGISPQRVSVIIKYAFLRWLRREARLAGRHRPEGRSER